MSRMIALRRRFSDSLRAGRFRTFLEYSFVFAGAYFLGESVAGEHVTATIGLVAVALFMFTLMRPLVGLTMLIVSAFSVEWVIALGLLPRAGQVIQPLLGFAVFLAIAARLPGRSGREAGIPALRWLLIFVLVGVLGAISNLESPMAMVMGLRPILTYVPLALAPLGLAMTEVQRQRMLRVLVALIVIQVPVAIVQFLFFRTGSSGDAVGGTLGGYASGSLTTLMIAAGTLFTGMLLYKAWPGIRGLAMTAMCFVPPALNETKVFFVAAPLIFGAILLPRARRSGGTIVLVGMMVAASVYGVFQSYGAVYNAQRTTSVEGLVAQQSGDELGEGGVMKRLPSIRFAFEDVTHSAQTFISGYGVGSLTRADFVGVQGRLLKQYGQLLRTPVWLARLVLEYGYGGLVAFMAMLTTALVVGRRIEVRDTSRVWRACGVGLQGTILTMAGLSVYTGTFTTDALNCTFYILLGLCGARWVDLRNQDVTAPIVEDSKSYVA